jgi:lipid-binding SYLF domain-containing protein
MPCARRRLRNPHAIPVAIGHFQRQEDSMKSMHSIVARAPLMFSKAIAIVFLGAAVLVPVVPAGAAEAAATKLDSEARSALRTLYAKHSGSKALGAQAVAILVFPRVTKAGFVVGGQYGEGALIKGGKSVAYYSTAGLSYGLQAGAQAFGYALFLMNEPAVAELDKADGFELGVGPSIVVVDAGAAKNLTTTTLKEDIYAVVFSQKGLMAGIGVQGNKISRIDPK